MEPDDLRRASLSSQQRTSVATLVGVQVLLMTLMPPIFLPIWLLSAAITGASEPGALLFAQVTHHHAPIASFTAPKGCVPDVQLVRQGLATQACIERFSPTHEFIIALHEYRIDSNDPAARATPELAKEAAGELVAKLYKENTGILGQTLAHFDTTTTPPASLPSGASYCLTLWTVMFDRRVPGYENQEFRMMSYDFICGRADLADNSLQVVDLRASERFNVSTDMERVKQRFGQPIAIPFHDFDVATRTLKLSP